MSELIFMAIPAFVVLLLVEALLSDAKYEAKDTWASLGMGVVNVLISVVTKAGALALYGWLYGYRLLDLSGLGLWIWPLLIVTEDFCYYWFHRAHHEVRVLWAAHVNHHSSERYNLSTALRQSWMTPVTGPLFWAPLPLLGFEPVYVLTAQAISLLYQFWIHTEVIDRLGPLEWVLNTPSHHRVHHGSQLEHLDRNHGGILILWDRLFGTFQREEGRPRYGLIDNIHTYNLFKIAAHEWVSMARDVAKAPTWGAKLRYIVGPPGWSHDGSKQTVAQLRAQLQSEPARAPEAQAGAQGVTAR
jgi:sterol desaturase/sphingolipid hydroxylase (fatty acid hydroxylase superfamily)